MALSLLNTSWADGVTLTSSALRNEFNNIYNNSLSLISPLTGNLDAGAFAITNLGAGSASTPSLRIGASDTGIWSNTASEELDLTVGGANRFSINTGDPVTFTMEGISAGANGPTLVLQHTSASPANGDNGGLIQWRNIDGGATSRVIGVIYVSHDDITEASQDSTMNFQVQNAVNAGNVNTTATLSSLGAWTDSSAAVGKKYIGDIDDVIGKMKGISFGVYHGRNVPDDKVEQAEKHYSSTAEDFYDVFGLGRDPAKGNPGIAPKDVAWLAVKMALELDERLTKLEEAA